MPPIQLDNIPANIRVPLAYVEFNADRAVQGLGQALHKILVIGQRLAAGSVAEAVPTQIHSADAAESAFGRGSMLHAMFAALKNANRYTEVWAIALDDAGAGTAAAGTITTTGPATGTGTINLYIAGKRIQVAVASGDSEDDITTAIIAAINAQTDLPVTAVVDGVNPNECDLTCRWKGETGNDIDVRINYQQGEKLPAGIAITFVAMAGGATNPDIATAIAVMGEDWYNTIVMPFTDATNLTALEAELLDRWGPLRQIDPVAYCAYRATLANTTTFGNGRNSQLVSCLGVSDKTLEPTYIFAAVNAAVAAGSLALDPARPLQTLTLPGLSAPAREDRWIHSERNTLLFDGIATFNVDANNNIVIERQITMYQKNSQGVADAAYLDVTTLATLSYIRYQHRQRIITRFPRYKLAADGTRVGPGQTIVTPSVIRGELLALFRELEDEGIVENFEQYQQDLLVEIDSGDPNRLNVLSSPDIVNQFRIFAEQIQFIV